MKAYYEMPANTPPDRQRAVVILGAGASIEYGMPATIALSEIIENAICADPWMMRIGGDVAFRKIKAGLSGYLTNPGVVQFEQIYHCVHELLHFYPPTPDAAQDYGAMNGWTIAHDRSAAVWDQGFQSFLAAPSALESCLHAIGVR